MKSVIIIMVSSLLMMPILFTVSSCEDNNELQPRRTNDGGTGGSEPIMLTRRSECTSNSDDKCEGSQCDNNTSYCGYSTVENEDGDTCNEVCKDLFTGKDARNTCLEYKPDVIFDVKELVDLLEQRGPTAEELEEEVDKQSLCVLLKIDPDPWVKEIKDYSPSRAETVFRWVVDENVSSYFVEDEHQKDFMKQLFSSLGGRDRRVTSDNIFDGFKEKVDVDEDEDERLPALFYLSENDGSRNSEAFQFVHELILVDEVCKKNRPEANVARVGNTQYNTHCGDDPCYGQDGEASSVGISARVSTEKAEDYFDLQACILGVYCHIADTLGSDDGFDSDDLRENAAGILNDGDVTEFIKAPIAEGGLELDDDDADDWTDAACEELKKYWNDNDDLNLGLGS